MNQKERKRKDAGCWTKEGFSIWSRFYQRVAYGVSRRKTGHRNSVVVWSWVLIIFFICAIQTQSLFRSAYVTFSFLDEIDRMGKPYMSLRKHTLRATLVPEAHFRLLWRSQQSERHTQALNHRTRRLDPASPTEAFPKLCLLLSVKADSAVTQKSRMSYLRVWTKGSQEHNRDSLLLNKRSGTQSKDLSGQPTSKLKGAHKERETAWTDLDVSPCRSKRDESPLSLRKQWKTINRRRPGFSPSRCVECIERGKYFQLHWRTE